MFCMHCGKPIQGDAAFCASCGKSVGQSHTEFAKEFWEQCEIAQELDGNQVYYRADAVGKSGRFNAGESPRWGAHFGVIEAMTDGIVETVTFGLISPSRERIKATEFAADNALRILVEKLVNDGWQPVPERGINHFELRFRRRSRA